MKTVDMTEAQGEQLLVDIAAHLPTGLDLGRPVAASGDVLGTSSGWFFREEGGCSTSRVVELEHGLLEMTTWVDGVEVSRFLGRVD